MAPAFGLLFSPLLAFVGVFLLGVFLLVVFECYFCDCLAFGVGMGGLLTDGFTVIVIDIRDAV